MSECFSVRSTRREIEISSVEGGSHEDPPVLQKEGHGVRWRASTIHLKRSETGCASRAVHTKGRSSSWYTATISTGAKVISRNAFVANRLGSFTTASAGSGHAPISLGTSGLFGVAVYCGSLLIGIIRFPRQKDVAPFSSLGGILC